MSKKIKKFVPNRHSGEHLTATSKLFCGKTLYLLLILFLSIALFAGLIFTVGDGSNGFLSNKPQDVSNAASSTPSNTSGMDGNFGYHSSFHNGVPIPLGIYVTTEFFTQTGILSYLQNKF